MGVRRVGVTGHRQLADPSQVRRDVDRVLERLGSREQKLVAVSSLAEGADRIVAHSVLSRAGCGLEVVLPLEPADYETDFKDAASVMEFRALLTAAASVTTLPPGDTREDAYERAGEVMLAMSDVVLALWDGGAARGRGGTAEIVASARRQRRPVEVVPVMRAL